ncbi:MAG TPA: lamin tail domain-containing protein, partial [Thermoguttaceae bacterium]|nr:lamin tail domain-containing protein [Thermoguttaceae bacterium]
FSEDRGFYDAPITVQITTDTVGADIYYTLDGSEPSATGGTLYTDANPILIDRTTVVRARAFKAALVPTDIDTQTYIFLDDVVDQSPDGEAPGVGWPTGDVNGQRINYGMDPDIVDGYNTIDEVKTSLLSIPTISMVTDLGNLFDESSGIFVHAGSDGPAWERPASIELIYPDGATGPGFPDGADGGFHINAGVRIRGGYSRSGDNPKHAFRLFFRDEYGDPGLNYALFGDEGADSFKKVDLRTTQNYSWAFGGPNNNTMVRDLYSREVQGALGHQYTRGRFYHLYVDGQYWGVFQTDERPSADFGETYYGGDSADYDVVKPDDNRRVIATDGNLDAYYRLWDATANIGYDDAQMDNYYRVQGMNLDGSPNPAYERLLDVDNLIDYMLITYYTGDRDGPGSWFTMGGSGPNNFFAIYDRENPDGFKFFEHDSEHSLDTGENTMVLRDGQLLGDTADEGWSTVAHLQDRFAPHWLHERLVHNSDYLQRFADRMYEVFYNGGEFDYDNSLARVNDIAGQIDQAMIAESARWGDTKTTPPKNHADWVGEVNDIRNWIVGRNDAVVNQVKAVGWYPQTEPATYYVGGSAQHGGSIHFGDVLTMTAPSGTIYYTLDGTDPADGGAVYSGPIVMNDVTHVRSRVLYNGEWSPLSKTTFYIDIASDIRITELMYNPSDPTPAEIAAGYINNDDFEYIEIKNISATESLPLTNLRLTDGVTYTFSNVWIDPGEFIVLAKNPAAFGFRYDTFAGTVVGPYDAGSLNNAGEMLQLDSPIGGIIHRFTYKDGWYGHTDGDGFSLTIRDPEGDSALWETADGWRASAAIGGTPGYEDTLLAPGSVIINEVLAHSDSPFVDTIELYNTTDATIDLGGWFLSDQKTNALGEETLTKYQLPGGMQIGAGGYLVLYEDQHFGSDFALSEHGEDVYLSS